LARSKTKGSSKHHQKVFSHSGSPLIALVPERRASCLCPYQCFAVVAKFSQAREHRFEVGSVLAC
jgi:hypothetical protein